MPTRRCAVRVLYTDVTGGGLTQHARRGRTPRRGADVGQEPAIANAFVFHFGKEAVRGHKKGVNSGMGTRYRVGSVSLNEIRSRSADILGSATFKKAAEVAATKTSPETWVQESHELAKTAVYAKSILDEVTVREASPDQPLQNVDLPLEYRQEAGRLAQQRVAEAGYRLAEVLRQVQK